MRFRLDTIVAPITGLPPAAVAVVRLSGPDAWSIAAQVFSPWPAEPTARVALYGHYVHGDDGLALPFQAGHSYTGEATVELSIHGSASSLHQLLTACEAAGARGAAPGEFTQRAFLNGRIDLTQAEAVRETIEADSEAQLRAANRNRDGDLRRRISALRTALLGILALVEATVDFSEEVGDLDRVDALRRVSPVIDELQSLAARSAASRLIRQGLRIAIVGPPNAGKSSLLNALLGVDRSIVSDIPGTTRDYVEEKAHFSGFPVVLVDTAGLRESDDPVESLGVQRSRVAAAEADLIWFVYDAVVGLSTLDRDTLAAFRRPVWVIGNKADLHQVVEGCPVSTLTGRGIDDLLRRTVEEFQTAGATAFVNERQAALIRAALASLEDARDHLEGETPADLLSVLLNEAISALGEITGEISDPDMIETIFSSFCIGK